jgi:hypothetical protein
MRPIGDMKVFVLEGLVKIEHVVVGRGIFPVAPVAREIEEPLTNVSVAKTDGLGKRLFGPDAHMVPWSGLDFGLARQREHASRRVVQLAAHEMTHFREEIGPGEGGAHGVTFFYQRK